MSCKKHGVEQVVASGKQDGNSGVAEVRPKGFQGDAEKPALPPSFAPAEMVDCYPDLERPGEYVYKPKYICELVDQDGTLIHGEIGPLGLRDIDPQAEDGEYPSYAFRDDIIQLVGQVNDCGADAAYAVACGGRFSIKITSAETGLSETFTWGNDLGNEVVFITFCQMAGLLLDDGIYGPVMTDTRSINWAIQRLAVEGLVIFDQPLVDGEDGPCYRLKPIEGGYEVTLMGEVFEVLGDTDQGFRVRWGEQALSPAGLSYPEAVAWAHECIVHGSAPLA